MCKEKIGIMLGRVLGGISTSLLFSAFESWMVTEHRRRGFPESLLASTFSYAQVGNGLLAVAAALAAALAASALESTPPRHRSRAVAYDRLASLAQDRGAVQEALALRAKAVGALATPTQIAEASLDPAVAYELAGVMHNYATLFCEVGDTSAATKTLDQTHRVCGVVPDAAEQEDCRRRCDALRRHIVKEG